MPQERTAAGKRTQIQGSLKRVEGIFSKLAELVCPPPVHFKLYAQPR